MAAVLADYFGTDLHHLFGYQRWSQSRHHAIVRELLRRCARKRPIPRAGRNSLSGEYLRGTQNGTGIGDYVFQSYLKPSAVAEHGGRAAPPSGWPPRWSRARVAGQAGSSLNP